MRPIINEGLRASVLSPWQLDALWSQGWHRLGDEFVRRSFSLGPGCIHWVQPLRVLLEHSRPGRSHRRILRRNRDLRLRVGRTCLDAERMALFERHRRRFTDSVPRSLGQFLGATGCGPVGRNVELALYAGDRLIAASYLDVGGRGAASVYAIFDPRESRRGLGILTMLLEMDHARALGCRYYYPGYAFHQPSRMDYKKQFSGMEWYDWEGHWHPVEGTLGPVCHPTLAIRKAVNGRRP